MRILIDCRMLYGEKSGIGYYLLHLLTALARIDRDNEYTLFYVTGEADPAKIVRLPFPNFQTRVLRFPNPVFMRLFADSTPLYRLGRALGGYDLVHEAGFGALPFARRSVVTLHDLIFFRLPDQYPPASAARYQKRLRESARNASLLIADSEQTRRDALEFLFIAPDKIRAVPLGVDAAAFAAPPAPSLLQAMRARLNIAGPYLLSIGDLYRRKNILTGIRAYARLSPSLRQEYQYVIAGATRDRRVQEELAAEIVELGLESRVLLAGYVPDGERTALLSGASALLYPSLYEGFGLPPLEAMAAGVPTISSDNSSIPEVVGDAGLLVADYAQPAAWSDAITRLLTDRSVSESLIALGRERAARFTWERAARATLEVYAQAAQR